MSEYQEKIEGFLKEIMTEYACGMLKTDRKIEFSVLGYKASKFGAALRGLEDITQLTYNILYNIIKVYLKILLKNI